MESVTIGKEDYEGLKMKVRELEEIIGMALNKKLLRQLIEELRKIKDGLYYSEEEFAKRHRLTAA